MTEAAFDLAAERTLGPMPARMRAVQTLAAPRYLFDPNAGFLPVQHAFTTVYSAEAWTEVILPVDAEADGAIIVNDARLTEIGLELLDAASQDSDQAMQSLMALTVYRVVLEQALPYPPSIFHLGALADYVGAAGIDEINRRRGRYRVERFAAEDCAVNLEEMTQFSMAHELTHFCLHADEDFARHWIGLMNAELSSLAQVLAASSKNGPAAASYLVDAIAERQRAVALAETEGLAAAPEAEECICDYSAILALTQAVDRAGTLKTGLDNLILSIWTILAARWLVVAIRQAVRELLEAGSTDLRSSAHVLLARGGAALLFLGRVVGERLHDDKATAQRLVADAWGRQPDFEGMILQAFDAVLNSDQVEKLAIVGQGLADAQLCRPEAAIDAIRACLGWTATD